MSPLEPGLPEGDPSASGQTPRWQMQRFCGWPIKVNWRNNDGTFRIRPGLTRAAGLERRTDARSQEGTEAQQVWAIRFWLDRERRLRDGALFDLAIDSKLHGCDVVKVRVGDLVSGGGIRTRAMVVQQKTGRPVQFELLEPARTSMLAWLERRSGALDDYAFPSRTDHSDHLSTRQYARLAGEWVSGIGLHCEDYGTHSLRRRRRSSTRRRETCALFRFCLATRRSRAQFATSALI